MKIKFLLPAALLVFLFSCKKETNERIEYFENGNIKKKTVYLSPVDKSNYREYGFYENETLKQITEFENGIRHGRDFSYYDNGNIKSVFYYDHGKLTSIGRYYGVDGRLTDKGIYINDSMVVKEEFFYNNNIMRTNIFSKITGNFMEAGSLLYDNKGLFGLDNSFYFITSSLDSISLQDSLLVNINMIAKKDPGSKINLVLGEMNETLEFTGALKDIPGDSLSLSFYYKPENTGYNLIMGKLYYHNPNSKAKIKEQEFIFYHDFLVY